MWIHSAGIAAFLPKSPEIILLSFECLVLQSEEHKVNSFKTDRPFFQEIGLAIKWVVTIILHSQLQNLC